MLRRLRANGPVVLVPAAWTVVAAAHLEVVTTRTLLVAHLTMDAVLAAFAALSWREMTEGVLLAWKLVLVAGLGATLLGTAGLAGWLPDGALLVTVAAWLLLPAAGLAYTGRRIDDGGPIYLGGAVLSVAAAPAYVPGALLGEPGWMVAGLVLAGVGQTAGIAVAVLDN